MAGINSRDLILPRMQLMWTFWQFLLGVGAIHKVTFASQDVEEVVKTSDERFFVPRVDFHSFVGDV